MSSPARTARRLAALVSATALLLLPFASAQSAGADVSARAKTYKNCTALNKDYPHGVGKVGAHDKTSSGSPVTNFKRSNALYIANSKSDRDNDKVACEKA